MPQSQALEEINGGSGPDLAAKLEGASARRRPICSLDMLCYGTKHAVLEMTKCTGVEYAPRGTIDTLMAADMLGGQADASS